MFILRSCDRISVAVGAWLVHMMASAAAGQPILGSEQLVPAGGVDIAVPGYSVPSYVDWDNDGRHDLIVGEGGGGVTEGRVRIYLNGGTPCDPEYSEFFYAQSSGQDLILPGSG